MGWSTKSKFLSKKQLFLQEVTVQVEFHDGSLKFWFGVAGAIYIAIGQYGSFRSGVNQIIEDAKSLKKIVYNDLKKHGVLDGQITLQKRLVTTPDKIRKVFLKIDRYESKSDYLNNEQKEKEINSIIKSVYMISYELSYEKDFELFLDSIKNTYKPKQLPNVYRLVYKRKEDEPPTLHTPPTNVGLLVDPVKKESSFLLPSTKIVPTPRFKNESLSVDIVYNSEFPGTFNGFSGSKKDMSLDDN